VITNIARLRYTTVSETDECGSRIEYCLRVICYKFIVHLEIRRSSQQKFLSHCTLDNSTSYHVVTASSGLDRHIPRQHLVTYLISVNITYHFCQCWPPRLYRLVRGNFTSLSNDCSYLIPRKLPQFVEFFNRSLHSPCRSIIILSCVLLGSHRRSGFEDCFAFKMEPSRQSVLDIMRTRSSLTSDI